MKNAVEGFGLPFCVHMNTDIAEGRAGAFSEGKVCDKVSGITAIQDYRDKRENGEEQDSPEDEFPGDGVSEWVEVESGIKQLGICLYYTRYQPGPRDYLWMMRKDARYLVRIWHTDREKFMRECPQEWSEILRGLECEEQESAIMQARRTQADVENKIRWLGERLEANRLLLRKIVEKKGAKFWLGFHDKDQLEILKKWQEWLRSRSSAVSFLNEGKLEVLLPFSTAVEKGHGDIVSLLLECDKQLLQSEVTIDNLGILHRSVLANQRGRVAWLIGALRTTQEHAQELIIGTFVSVIDSKLPMEEKKVIFDWMLEDYDINLSDRRSWGGGTDDLTFFLYCASIGYSQGVQFFIEYSKSPGKTRVLWTDPEVNRMKQTALHLAAMNGSCTTTGLLLYYHSEIIDLVDKENKTALYLAAEKGQAKTVELLLRCGADVYKGCDLAALAENHSNMDVKTKLTAAFGEYFSLLIQKVQHSVYLATNLFPLFIANLSKGSSLSIDDKKKLSSVLGVIKDGGFAKMDKVLLDGIVDDIKCCLKVVLDNFRKIEQCYNPTCNSETVIFTREQQRNLVLSLYLNRSVCCFLVHFNRILSRPSHLVSASADIILPTLEPKKGNKVTIVEEPSVVAQHNFHPGLQYQSVIGDGDCLYRSVTYYLSRGEDVSFLRRIVALNLKCDGERYVNFIPLQQDQSLQDYVKKVKDTHQWAGELEINILMELLNRPIVIVGPEGTIRNKDAIERYRGKEPIFVFYNGGDERGSDKPGHYDALILRDGYNSLSILTEMLESSAMREGGAEAKSVVEAPALPSSLPMPTTSQVIFPPAIFPLINRSALSGHRMNASTVMIHDSMPIKDIVIQQLVEVGGDRRQELEVAVYSHEGFQRAVTDMVRELIVSGEVDESILDALQTDPRIKEKIDEFNRFFSAMFELIVIRTRGFIEDCCRDRDEGGDLLTISTRLNTPAFWQWLEKLQQDTQVSEAWKFKDIYNYLEQALKYCREQAAASIPDFLCSEQMQIAKIFLEHYCNPDSSLFAIQVGADVGNKILQTIRAVSTLKNKVTSVVSSNRTTFFQASADRERVSEPVGSVVPFGPVLKLFELALEKITDLDKEVKNLLHDPEIQEYMQDDQYCLIVTIFTQDYVRYYVYSKSSGEFMEQQVIRTAASSGKDFFAVIPVRNRCSRHSVDRLEYSSASQQGVSEVGQTGPI